MKIFRFSYSNASDSYFLFAFPKTIQAMFNDSVILLT